MEILDAQIHTWLSDRPTHPWTTSYRQQFSAQLGILIHAGLSMSPEAVLGEMAEAGVDGGALAPIGVYGVDNRFELAAAHRYPRKYCVVGWTDHVAPNAGDQLLDDVAAGMRGVRILSLREPERLRRQEFDPVLRACQRHGCAVSLPLRHPIATELIELFARFDDITFLIDHLGLGHAPLIMGPRPAEPFADLGAVLELAKLPNVVLKLTGAPALSQLEFPFPDLFPFIEQIVSAFGVERVAWGSDFTRTGGLFSYWDGTHYLAQMPGVSPDDLAWLYGKALRKALNWPSNPHVRSGPVNDRVQGV